jgi:Endomembrane protein 70
MRVYACQWWSARQHAACPPPLDGPSSLILMMHLLRCRTPHAYAAVPVPRTHVCSQALSPADVADFAYAVQRHYWYELFLDGLPVWGFVGELREPHAAAGSGSAADGAAVAGTVSGSGGEVWVYTHKQLDISYNGDRVRDRAYARSTPFHSL